MGVLTDGTGQSIAGQVLWGTSDPARLQINPATGAATALSAGPVTVSATVGTTVGTASITVQSTAAGDATPPAATIALPANNALITAISNVTGTATDPNFSQYVLDYAIVGSLAFTEIATGTTAVTNGILGQFDPTLLINDIYTVRLRVFDRGGNVTTTSRTYQVTRDQKVGAFSLRFQDVVVPVGTLPIVINRVYDTRDKSVGDFGFGWRLDIQTMRLRATPNILGEGWQQTRSGGFIPNYCITHGTHQHKVSITLPDGKVEEFDMGTNPPCQQAAPIQFGDVVFTPRSGTRGTLTALDSTAFFWTGGAPASGDLLDDETFEPINPQRFRYTTPDKYIYIISRTAGVERITDPNGNFVIIGPNGITHSSGPSVTFIRDGSGRITQINAPGAEVHNYAYSAAGDLLSYSDAAASLTRYFYNLSHGLLEIRNPRGLRPIRNEYDDSGRLAATIDAFGNRMEYAHDLAQNRETITDRLGRVKLIEYDATGNVTRETHPDGTTTQRSFDARGNALTESNGLGGVVTRTYNPLDLPLTKRDELGNLVETYTYDATGNILTFTDGRGNVTTHAYDASGNRTRTTDGEGFITQWTYDAKGNVLTATDPRGGITTNVYDGSSNLIRVTDPVGTVTSYTYDAGGRRLSESFTRTTAGGPQLVETRFAYDAAGRLTQTTHPDGSTSRNEYDAVGNLTAEIDQLGRRTTHEYDASNRRIKTTFPDLTTERAVFDAEGQRTATIDRAGRTTAFTYDVRGRVKRTIAPDGTFIERQYDNAGRLTGVLDENGHGTTQTFDAAGRVLTEVDATGRTTTNTYDIVGNRTSSTDAGGQTTTYEYDRRNLLTRANFTAGAGSERYVYNQAGQLTSTFDADNAETRQSFDLLGRLTQVTNPLNQSWTFTYDQAGNRVTQTDPLGRLTTFAYDAVKRETRRTLPGGLFQQWQYDAAGNLTTRIDYGGATTTFHYDSNNRLLRRTHPDTSQVNFTYTPTGQRATAVDVRGVTTYTYDARDRVTAVMQPDGTALTYAYDLAHNMTSRTADLGATELTQSFTYDNANRLSAVTDSRARTYTYAYTPAGKVASLAQPNGVTTSYSYGPMQRLTSLAASTAGGTLRSFGYTLSPSGRRTRIDEAAGVSRQYTYDTAGRVTGETVSGPAGYADTFSYDAAGNRTSRGHTPAGGVLETTAYTYDARDQALTEGGVTNTWDANGRLTSRSDGTSHVWDSEGRLLLTALAAGGSVTNTYDADGVRVSTTTFAAGGGAPDTTHLLVDTRAGLSHVVVEYATGGAVKAEYVRGGDQLLAVVRPAGTRFYHADGLGSIRALTDETATVTDTYEYDAFGTITARTGTDPNPYQFTGEPYSPITGLYHLRARWMHPGSGRFLSVDPRDGVAEQPNTLHRYIYGNGDPVNVVDPTGEFGFSLGGISISINIQGTLRAQSGTGARLTLQAVRKKLARFAGDSVKNLKKLRDVGDETHHLIEQRLWNANPALRNIWKHVDDMPGVNLSRAEHQVFTNAWRNAFPYSNQAGHIARPSIDDILGAAQKIYANHPELLRHIYYALL
jgi:RHS repeat-associated protein